MGKPGALALALVFVACGDNSSTDTDTEDTAAATAATADTTTTDTPDSSTGATDDTSTPATATATATTTDATTGDPTGDPTDPSTGDPFTPMGHFLAVGDGGRRVRSIDGVTWDGQVGTGLLDTDDEAAAPDALRALAAGDGYIIAVGGGGNFYKANTLIMRSTDGGLSWQEDLLKDQPDDNPHKLHGVAASGQVVVAVGLRGKRIRSDNGGLDWTDISFEDQASRLQGVAAQADTFVVIGWSEDAYDAPKTSVILTSPDLGLTWAPVDESFARLDAIAAGNGTFVTTGLSNCLRSQDGLAWTDCGPLSADYKGISFADGEFLLSTSEGIVTSLDGLSWTSPILPRQGTPAQVARGNGRHVGIRWTDRGWSTELTTWNYQTWATEPLRAILFVPTP